MLSHFKWRKRLSIFCIATFAFLAQSRSLCCASPISAKTGNSSKIVQGPLRCESGREIDGEALVRFAEGVTPTTIRGIVSSLFGDQESPLLSNVSDNLNIYLVQSPQLSTDKLLEKFNEDKVRQYVEEREPNLSLCIDTQSPTNNPHFKDQWALFDSGGISAVSAWNTTKGSDEIVVGIIDTGIDREHPDLTRNIWKAPLKFNVRFKGFPRPCPYAAGWDAIGHSCDPKDSGWHGTHVAGIIGASNNEIGVVGVNWYVRLMALKAFNFYGWGSVASVIEAIDVALQAKLRFGVNIRVLNNSYGQQCNRKKDCGSNLLEKAIELTKKNEILFVAAAGQADRPLNNDDNPHYPSSYKTENIVAVAWTDRMGKLSPTSNYGLTSVDLGAPGSEIWSTFPIAYVAQGGYYETGGTSMATPFVSGTAALVLARCPNLKTVQLKDLLVNKVDGDSTLAGKTVSGGRLNAFKAVNGCNKIK